MLVVGLALVVAGLGGCVMVGAVALVTRPYASQRSYATSPGWDGTVPRLVAPQSTQSLDASGSMSAGEILYLTGIGRLGTVPYTGGPAWFQHTTHGCVGCHGVDGLSRSVTSTSGGQVATGDIRYDSLAGIGVTAETTATVGGWTDEDIVAAIRDGVAPDGSALDPTMPHWTIDDTDMASLLEHLKELSSR
jgi:mono/diheme cytochrome c family protein